MNQYKNPKKDYILYYIDKYKAYQEIFRDYLKFAKLTCSYFE